MMEDRFPTLEEELVREGDKIKEQVQELGLEREAHLTTELNQDLEVKLEAWIWMGLEANQIVINNTSKISSSNICLHNNKIGNRTHEEWTWMVANKIVIYNMLNKRRNSNNMTTDTIILKTETQVIIKDTIKIKEIQV